MLTRSASVRPFLESLTTMSFTVPVSVPPGSPLAKSSGFGPAIALRSASVMGTGGALFAAGALGALVAGAACAYWTGEVDCGSAAATIGTIQPDNQMAASNSDTLERSLFIMRNIWVAPSCRAD